ncbi:DoxX family membrane protein [bacterium]|nr:DoxX family membrane protein [bacterium]MBU1025077.1 DoxX family membrane protein [bacterium]
MNKISTSNSSFGFREFISLVIRLLIGLMFIFASYEKIIKPEGFLKAVVEYNILPDQIAPFFAVVLPWIEMVVGVFLVLGLFIRASGLIIFILMLIFELAIIINLVQGNKLDCGCGLPLDFLGVSDKITWLTVLRDMIFVVMAAEIAFWSKPGFALEQIFLQNKSIPD